MKDALSLVMALGGVFAATEAGAARLASPAYFYPDCLDNPACFWAQLDAGAPSVGLAVVNPDSGPGVVGLFEYVL